MSFPDIRGRIVAYDTEATGLKWWTDRVFGFSIAVSRTEGYYWDIRRHPEAWEWWREECKYARLIVAHNFKYDYHISRESGVTMSIDNGNCTVVRAALIDEHRLTYNLDSLGKDCIGVGKTQDIWPRLAEMFGGKPTLNAQIMNLPKAPESLVASYAIPDATTCFGLWEWQEAEIAKQGLEKVHDLERRLMPVIIRMEKRGVPVDVEETERAIKRIDDIAKREQHELDQMAGFATNPNPSSSIHKLFVPENRGTTEKPEWYSNCGTRLTTTDAGKASLDADALRAMKHPAAKKILMVRKLLKTRDTFMKGHILGHHHNGIIHANYNQTKSDNDLGTGTGRFSINEPALQQIHKRDKEIAAIVRSLFLPFEGQDWLCADWGQFEQRWFGHYARNATIIETYRENPRADFYQTVSNLTGIPRDAQYAGDGKNTKQLTLGSIFGMSAGRMAEECGLPFTIEKGRNGREWKRPGPEAEELFAKFYGAVPGIREFLDGASSVAKQRGYVITAGGRHIRFPGGHSTHKAGGLILQGSAGDALKQKMIELDAEFEGTETQLMLCVHDENDFSAPRGDMRISKRIEEIYTDFSSAGAAIKCRIPITCDVGRGANWWQACKD